MKKLLVCIGAIVCVSLLSGCASTGMPAISVDTAALKSGTFADGYSTVGEVLSQTQVDVIPKYPGTVEQAFVAVGDNVSAGQPLFQLDTTDIDKQISDLQASISTGSTQKSLALSQAEGARDQALLAATYPPEGTSPQVHDQLVAAYHAAQAQVDSLQAQDPLQQAQQQLQTLKNTKNDYTVTSPISGVVVSKNIVTGGMAGQTMPAYTVSNLDQVIVSTSVPKDEIDKLAIGGDAQVFTSDGSAIQTQITTLSSAANAAGLFMVQVTVDNKDSLFKQGMTANMVLVASQTQSLIVPPDSVVTSGRDAYIFVADNNTAKKIPVKVLGRNADQISIAPVSGTLTAGTQIVTTGANMLKDGDPIKTK
ncbi:MAG: efflux RND transporter periplasmic adaptor subunit [Clostridiales bacterium]|nr:efflux RND transporter periplasmic adaptor subunit [Clostridiales bacterium]